MNHISPSKINPNYLLLQIDIQNQPLQADAYDDLFEILTKENFIEFIKMRAERRKAQLVKNVSVCDRIGWEVLTLACRGKRQLRTGMNTNTSKRSLKSW